MQVSFTAPLTKAKISCKIWEPFRFFCVYTSRSHFCDRQNTFSKENQHDEKNTFPHARACHGRFADGLRQKGRRQEQRRRSLALLTKVWDSYTDDEKFPAAGGDYETSVDDAPGAFDPSNADNLNFLLTVPTEDASLIDDAASLMHMMNANTFTCGALRVKNGDDAAKLAEDLRDAIQNKQWMCGFPDKLVIATLGNYVVSVYGDEELVNTFRDKLQAAYSDAAIAYDEMIGEGEFSDGEDTALEAPVA